MIAPVHSESIDAAKGKLLPIAKFVRSIGFGGWAAGAMARYGWPRQLIFYGSGIGDDLLCTTVARELRKRDFGKVWVGARYPELFDCNPDMRAVPIADWRYGTLARFLGADVRPLWYTVYEPEIDRDPEPPNHIAAMMCQKAGISGRVSIKPYLFLRRDERAEGKFADNQIAIQSSTRSAATPLQNKEWLPQRFQSVVNAFCDRFQFVQLGSLADPKLDGVIDLRGKTTLRQAAATISQSRLFVGLVSGLMHLSRAVDRSAVIVYGGRERPEISGYICNRNITSNPPCSPCWQRNRCDHDRVCMTSIGAKQVNEAVTRILDSTPVELAVQQISL
jgi:Glycosyltransferase family 9 (heptosyltransferase)